MIIWQVFKVVHSKFACVFFFSTLSGRIILSFILGPTFVGFVLEVGLKRRTCTRQLPDRPICHVDGQNNRSTETDVMQFVVR